MRAFVESYKYTQREGHYLEVLPSGELVGRGSSDNGDTAFALDFQFAKCGKYQHTAIERACRETYTFRGDFTKRTIIRSANDTHNMKELVLVISATEERDT